MNALTLLGQEYDSSEESDLEMIGQNSSKSSSVFAHPKPLIKNHNFRRHLSKPRSVDEDVKRLMNSLISKVETQILFHTHRNTTKEIDFTSESEIDFSDSEDNEEDEESLLKKLLPPTTKGELTYDDLPPVEKLNIRMNVSDLQQIGRISSIVFPLIVIQSFKNSPALNLDSVLFCKNAEALGRIFDVFGSVSEPCYSVRFNHIGDLKQNDIEVGMPVYFVPKCDRAITDYVFVHELRKLKGSDASWLQDNEPPEHVKEYSDDEEERLDKMKKKGKRRRDTNKINIPENGWANQEYFVNHRNNYFANSRHQSNSWNNRGHNNSQFVQPMPSREIFGENQIKREPVETPKVLLHATPK